MITFKSISRRNVSDKSVLKHIIITHYSFLITN